jgi:hypothetical protein
LAAPHAALCDSRGCFLLKIVCRVSPVRERPTLRYHPSAQILAADATDRDNATVAVDVALLAGDGALTDVVGQGECCLLPATIRLAGGLAGLAGLRRVNAEEPNALTVDLDRVAVDYRSSAYQVACGGFPCASESQG